MLLMSLVLSGVAEAGRLRIGVYGQNPPKGFVDERGDLAGFDIDFARALCAQIKFECELVPSDWSELIPGLVAHRFDAVVASLSITDARRKLVAFTRPYYDSPGRFVARAGRFETFDPQTVQGLRLGVRRGTTFDDYATANLAERVEIFRYSTQPDALADLVLGRIDLVLGDHIVIDKNFLETEPGEGFAFVGPPLGDPRWFGYGNGVALTKGDSALLQLLDQAVADMHVNGVFERIQRRWFGYDVRNLTAVLQAQHQAAED